MANQTRLQKAQAKVKSQAEHIDGLILEGTKLIEEATELKDEVQEAHNINHRLNKTLKDRSEKIANLKNVARFYRAQRDRVDAYLSAVLDMMDMQKHGEFKDETAPVEQLEDVIMHAERAMKHRPPGGLAWAPATGSGAFGAQPGRRTRQRAPICALSGPGARRGKLGELLIV